MKKAYRYNGTTKIYEGEVICQLDPLETKESGKDIWLIPANSTLTIPLKEKDGYNVVWNGESWEYDKIPVSPEPPEPTEEEQKENMRAIRNGYLMSTDFTQLQDAPFTKDEKAKYREYRQYLRDYTEQENWWKEEPKTFEEWDKE